MKYCRKCGKALQDDSKFCSGCGTVCEEVTVSTSPQGIAKTTNAGIYNNSMQNQGGIAKNLKAESYVIVERVLQALFIAIFVAGFVQIITLFCKMPDCSFNYFVRGVKQQYDELKDTYVIKKLYNATTFWALIFTIITMLFASLKKDFGIITLVGSIVVFATISSVLNFIYAQYSYGEFHYTKEMFKAELKGEHGSSTYFILSATRVIILVCGILNAAFSTLSWYLKGSEEAKKYTNDNEFLVKIRQNPLLKKDDEINASEGEWRCSECGTINKSYVGTCRCGCNKS